MNQAYFSKIKTGLGTGLPGEGQLLLVQEEVSVEPGDLRDQCMIIMDNWYLEYVEEGEGWGRQKEGRRRGEGRGRGGGRGRSGGREGERAQRKAKGEGVKGRSRDDKVYLIHTKIIGILL